MNNKDRLTQADMCRRRIQANQAYRPKIRKGVIMQIFINPGSGPVDDSTEQNAIDNMRHFITDHQEPNLDFVRLRQSDYGKGRYAFLLYKVDGTRCHEIQMPGIPLNMVRFMDDENQNIWDFPRLYIDGNSYVWQYAILDSEDDWKEPE